MKVRLFKPGPAIVLAVFVGCGATPEPSVERSNAERPVATGTASSASSDSPTVTSTTTRPGAGEESPIPGEGTLTGRITFTGEIPEPRMIQVTKDREHCHDAAGEVRDVLVDENGGLADVVVEIYGIENNNGWEWDDPPEGYVIRQRGCRFEPHVMLARDGAELVIYNDDEVHHNINTGQWNVVQAPAREPIRQPLRFGGQPWVRVTCNIHNWMEAWVYVRRSPHCARTSEDGTYSIEGIPAGTYRAYAVHPTLGRQRLNLDITAGETVEQNVTFE